MARHGREQHSEAARSVRVVRVVVRMAGGPGEIHTVRAGAGQRRELQPDSRVELPGNGEQHGAASRGHRRVRRRSLENFFQDPRKFRRRRTSLVVRIPPLGFSRPAIPQWPTGFSFLRAIYHAVATSLTPSRAVAILSAISDPYSRSARNQDHPSDKGARLWLTTATVRRRRKGGKGRLLALLALMPARNRCAHVLAAPHGSDEDMEEEEV